MKNFLPLIPFLLKQPISDETLLATLKCFGTLVCQASVVPTRSQGFYKEIIETQIENEICNVIMAGTAPQANIFSAI
jgi:hypothetical protein